MAFRRDSPGRFDRGSRSSGSRFGGGRGGFGGRSERRSEMFDVTCSKCGKECRVPFKPTGSKPVFCSDCFRQGGDSAPSRFNSNSGSSSGGMSSEQASQINAKLDKILGILSNLEIVPEDGEESEESEEDSEENFN